MGEQQQADTKFRALVDEQVALLLHPLSWPCFGRPWDMGLCVGPLLQNQSGKDEEAISPPTLPVFARQRRGGRLCAVWRGKVLDDDGCCRRSSLPGW